MELGHLFETAMLVCFGFSWPLNVRKAYRARTAKGTSLAFIFLIITGYVAGILAKFINHQINYVLAVYFLNLAIVMLNVFVYIRNRSLDKKAAAACRGACGIGIGLSRHILSKRPSRTLQLDGSVANPSQGRRTNHLFGRIIQ